jgi:hypothetical protein
VGPENRDFLGPCYFEGHWKGRALEMDLPTSHSYGKTH